MGTIYILQYEKLDGSGEYIVITEDNSPENIDANRKQGWKIYKVYEFEGHTGNLPLDRCLSAE
jgi:hypothetical protein